MRALLSMLLLTLSTLTASAQARPHRRRAAAPRVAPSAAPSPTSVVEPEMFALPPIERSTVRVLALHGIRGRVVTTSLGHSRLVASTNWSHGTGVMIRADGVMLTARHVVEGADLLAVVFPGQRVAVPAMLLYADPVHDLAFVQVQTASPIRDVTPLPTTLPRPVAGQSVSITGYPIDPTERYPARTAGDLARFNNDGRMQLSLAANPGNSGGPAFDAQQRLMGVVIQRGRLERGVEGLTFVEPIQYAVRALARDVRALPQVTFGPHDAEVAQSMFDLLQLDPDRDEHDPASRARVLALAAVDLSPEATCAVAAHAWNEAITLLEIHHAAEVSDLPSDRRAEVEALVQAATALNRRAITAAPYLRESYGFVYFFQRIEGRLVAPPLSPVRDSDEARGEVLNPVRETPVAAVGAAAQTPASAGGADDASLPRASRAKLVAFLRRRLHLDAVTPDIAARRVVIRLRLSPSGALLAGAVTAPSGSADADASLATQLRALVERHPRVEALSSAEEASLSDRDLDLAFTLQDFAASSSAGRLL